MDGWMDGWVRGSVSERVSARNKERGQLGASSLAQLEERIDDCVHVLAWKVGRDLVHTPLVVEERCASHRVDAATEAGPPRCAAHLRTSRHATHACNSRHGATIRLVVCCTVVLRCLLLRCHSHSLVLARGAAVGPRARRAVPVAGRNVVLAQRHRGNLVDPFVRLQLEFRRRHRKQSWDDEALKSQRLWQHEVVGEHWLAEDLVELDSRSHGTSSTDTNEVVVDKGEPDRLGHNLLELLSTTGVVHVGKDTRRVRCKVGCAEVLERLIDDVCANLRAHTDRVLGICDGLGGHAVGAQCSGCAHPFLPVGECAACCEARACHRLVGAPGHDGLHVEEAQSEGDDEHDLLLRAGLLQLRALCGPHLAEGFSRRFGRRLRWASRWASWQGAAYLIGHEYMQPYY